MGYQQILDDLVFAWLIVMYEDKEVLANMDDVNKRIMYLLQNNKLY
jgi:hypothetical protein